MPVTKTAIFTLNNTGIHHSYAGHTFLTFRWLVIKDSPMVLSFLQTNGYFDFAAFDSLYDRIVNNPDTLVPFSEKDLIIFYAVTMLLGKAYLEDSEEPALLEASKDTLEDTPEQALESFMILREKQMSFCTGISEKFLRDFAHVPSFIEATKKIIACLD